MISNKIEVGDRVSSVTFAPDCDRLQDWVRRRVKSLWNSKSFRFTKERRRIHEIAERCQITEQQVRGVVGLKTESKRQRIFGYVQAIADDGHYLVCDGAGVVWNCPPSLTSFRPDAKTIAARAAVVRRSWTDKELRAKLGLPIVILPEYEVDYTSQLVARNLKIMARINRQRMEKDPLYSPENNDGKDD